MEHSLVAATSGATMHDNSGIVSCLSSHSVDETVAKLQTLLAEARSRFSLWSIIAAKQRRLA